MWHSNKWVRLLAALLAVLLAVRVATRTGLLKQTKDTELKCDPVYDPPYPGAQQGDSPLMEAIRTGHRLRVDSSAINHQNCKGETALSLAANKGMAELVKQLIQRGADSALLSAEDKKAVEELSRVSGGTI